VSDRPYDIVLLGATGFTGGLAAEYLARNAPPAPGLPTTSGRPATDLPATAPVGTAPPVTRWALAGRNRGKLEAVRGRLAEIDERCADVVLLEADVSDSRSIDLVAESTKVLITTVGPYVLYGEAPVAACAAAGTDYVDLTGEPEFVDLMWLRHHEQACRTGARIVHSCGFDSIPYDLGALYTVSRLPEGVPLTLEGFVRVGGSISGGTYETAINNMARRRQSAWAARERRSREACPQGRNGCQEAGPRRRVQGAVRGPHRDQSAGGLGGWVVSLPTIDPQTVLRSARALERYGPAFTYSQYLVLERLSTLAAMTAGAGAALALAQLAPTRNALLRLGSPKAGSGPSSRQREKGWFRVRFVGEGGGTRVVTEVSGGDPGYTETAKMLCESALCLAHDELSDGLPDARDCLPDARDCLPDARDCLPDARDGLPDANAGNGGRLNRAGQLTPAVAMGQPLIDRLVRAGISFRTLGGE